MRKNTLVEEIKKFIKQNTLFLIGCLVFVLLWAYIFLVAFSFNYSISGSMEPTIMTNDITVVSRLAYLSKEPQRGDIISFKREEEIYGKRIVGIAGDIIEFHDGYTYINGELYDESQYLGEDVETNCIKTFEVPEGCVFVMGDNRENSNDSRVWDDPYVKTTDIIGKNVFILKLHNFISSAFTKDFAFKNDAESFFFVSVFC